MVQFDCLSLKVKTTLPRRISLIPFRKHKPFKLPKAPVIPPQVVPDLFSTN